VGKTCILLRFVEGGYNSTFTSTVGCEAAATVSSCLVWCLTSVHGRLLLTGLKRGLQEQKRGGGR
jgi:hypothetical protein